MKELLGLCLLLIIILFAKCSSGDITLDGSTKCGQFVCKRGEYCSTYHNKCEPCAGICDEKNHNYDPSGCVGKCQDFLHDARYALKNEPGGNEDLRATVQRLSHMIVVILALVCFILVVLAAVLFVQLYRWKKKKNITMASVKKFFTKKPSEPAANTKPTNQNIGKKLADLRLEINSPSTQLDSPVTISTSISRRPAEDSALDYAYDNPAMTNSSPTKPNESRF